MQSNLILVFILSAAKLNHEHFGSFADALITFQFPVEPPQWTSSKAMWNLSESTCSHVPLYIQLKETIIQIFGKSNQDGFTFVVTHHGITLFSIGHQDCSSRFSKYKFKMYLLVDCTSSLFSLGSYFPLRSWYLWVTAETVYVWPSIVTLSPQCMFYINK